MFGCRDGWFRMNAFGLGETKMIDKKNISVFSSKEILVLVLIFK
jgi:hypothetical protein